MALLEVAAVCALERARWRRASRCRCSVLLSVAAGRTLQGDALGCGFRVTAVGTLRVLLEGAAVRVVCAPWAGMPVLGAAVSALWSGMAVPLWRVLCEPSCWCRCMVPLQRAAAACCLRVCALWSGSGALWSWPAGRFRVPLQGGFRVASGCCY